MFPIFTVSPRPVTPTLYPASELPRLGLCVCVPPTWGVQIGGPAQPTALEYARTAAIKSDYRRLPKARQLRNLAQLWRLRIGQVQTIEAALIMPPPPVMLWGRN